GGQTVANSAVVALGARGGITLVAVNYGTDVIIDVNGYYAPRTLVSTLNSLSGDITLAPGPNISIIPSGNTLTIAATSGGGTITGVTAGTGLMGGGVSGNVTLGIAPAGVTADRIAPAQVVKKVNGAQDSVMISGSGSVTVSTVGNNVTIGGGGGVPHGSFVYGSPSDTTLIGAGFTEIGPSSQDAWFATAASAAPSPR